MVIEHALSRMPEEVDAETVVVPFPAFFEIALPDVQIYLGIMLVNDIAVIVPDEGILPEDFRERDRGVQRRFQFQRFMECVFIFRVHRCDLEIQGTGFRFGGVRLGEQGIFLNSGIRRCLSRRGG